MCNHRIGSEAVHEALPISDENLVKCTLAAMQVFVERRKVRSKVWTCACGPHEQPQGALKVLAKDLL